MNYSDKFNSTIEQMNQFYNTYGKEENFKEQLIKYYIEKKLDPDGFAYRNVNETKCTADGLLSIRRICHFEKTSDIISVYEKYRKYPIFYFPQENGGINTTRSTVFGDRIDHTLYDIKNYYDKNSAENCRMKKAFNRKRTKKWLANKTFENIVDFFGIKGIFVDNNYNVYDLSSYDRKTLKKYQNRYSYDWTEQYYNNLKMKIEEFNCKQRNK